MKWPALPEFVLRNKVSERELGDGRSQRLRQLFGFVSPVKILRYSWRFARRNRD